MLFGHDESFPYRDDGACENRCWGVDLRGQGQNRLCTGQYGCRRGFPAGRAGFTGGVRTLGGGSGGKGPETVPVAKVGDLEGGELGEEQDPRGRNAGRCPTSNST